MLKQLFYFFNQAGGKTNLHAHFKGRKQTWEICLGKKRTIRENLYENCKVHFDSN